jgi:hypothetical protein
MLPAPADPVPAVELARTQLAQLSGQPDLPLPEVFRRVCEAAAEGLGVARAGIWLLVNGDQALRCVSLFDRSNHKHTKGTLLSVGDFPSYLLAAGTALPCEDTFNDPRTAELRDTYLAPHGIRSLLDAPLLRDDRLVGVVSHEHTGQPRTWTEAERVFARSVADVVVERMQAAEGVLARTGTWMAPQLRNLSAPERPTGVAHELRELLANILTEAAAIVRMAGLPQEAVTRLGRIDNAVHKAEALIRERLGPNGGEVGR